ncbi:hypothetical protein [Rhodonellum sp.]|uniref:hypothetical protein n=1 Tax=Rhodonellum sp. TaxID=2231180 RepID=UPI002725A87D|nr:hypothetical protein [Rhodonellum sp.]MDO9552231.1 hypothetical protein [Rhodonellum sp.]
MAKQTSIITLNGKIGGISFYKTKDGYQAREKGGVSKSRIMTDPRYARTRENMQEFAENATAAKLLKDAIRPAIVKISDPKLHNRLSSQMMKVLKSDLVNTRGNRKVSEGDWNLISGMELNARSSLSSTVLVEITLLNTPSDWTVSLPPFNPMDFLVVPEGASHFRLFAVGASVDFTTSERSFVQVPTVDLPVSAVTDPIILTVSKASLSESNQVYVLGVEFVQMVNGQEYAINNGAHNAAVILLTEKV